MKISTADKKVILFGLKGLIALILLYVLQKYIIHDFIGNVIVDNAEYYCLLIWIVYAIVEGSLHAYYYTHHSASSYKEDLNEHFMFVIMRSCVLFPMLILNDFYTIICYCLIFPFFHNGMYYTKRNNLSPEIYQKKWFDHSKTSTAVSTRFLTPLVRTIMFVIGIILLILKTRT